MKIPFLAISIWMFICMTIFGVVSYAYVLWRHYWYSAMEKKQMILNTGRFIPRSNLLESNSNKEFSNSVKNNNTDWVPDDKLNSKIHTYRNQLLVQLRKAQLAANNVLFHKDKEETNIYKVKFKRKNVRLPPKSQQELICELKNKVKVQMLTEGIEPFKTLGYDKYFPSQPISSHFNKHKSCAMVSSAGSMYKSKLGKEIGRYLMSYGSFQPSQYQLVFLKKKTILRF